MITTPAEAATTDELWAWARAAEAAGTLTKPQWVEMLKRCAEIGPEEELEPVIQLAATLELVADQDELEALIAEVLPDTDEGDEDDPDA